MTPIKIDDVTDYVAHNIDNFHKRRIESLDRLKLKQVLKRKNPYLFKAKNMSTASQIVSEITDAHISSHEETIFGGWLEKLAIFVNQKAYGGHKSTAEGIDLEFDKGDIRYIISIKSGPNWGNSSQIAKMQTNFTKAIKILRTGNERINVRAINGCCYGIDKNPNKDSYQKLCGQEFWSFISGNEELYKDIIEPLGYNAKKKNDDFRHSYNRKINLFTKEFLVNFCTNKGEIDWIKLLEFNSKK